MKGEESELSKELGDVLHHVFFYVKKKKKKKNFDIVDVINFLCDKLIYRHPHVFGDVVAETAGEVCKNWEQLKLKEKGGNKSLLSGVPVTLPSLIKAYRMQEKAANVGFDWEKKEDVWGKVQEEISEVEKEMRSGNKADFEKEFGDLLFSLVNASRLYGINPDNALEQTNDKFRSRFNYVEQNTIKQGRNLRDMSLEEMDALRNEAKKGE